MTTLLLIWGIIGWLMVCFFIFKDSVAMNVIKAYRQEVETQAREQAVKEDPKVQPQGGDCTIRGFAEPKKVKVVKND